MPPNPSFVYETIGGILDMYFFLGPTPDDCNKQYSDAIGKWNILKFNISRQFQHKYFFIGRYHMPPYWSLGFHLCRYGYNSLENMQAAVDRTTQYGIPHDAQWGDIDIMDRELDFTVSPDR